MPAPPGVLLSGRVRAPRAAALVPPSHPHSRMDLSVVVVTYQSRDHILHCLRSLDAGVRASEASAPPPTWECVVLDNDSRDGTPECVASEAPWARLVRTGANLGYAKAVNRGIAETSGARPRVRGSRPAATRSRGSAPAPWRRSSPRCRD